MASSIPMQNNFLFPTKDPTGLPGRSLLITGQKITGQGTAQSGELIKNITTFQQVEELFGKSSHITNNLRFVFDTLRLSNVRPQINACALEYTSGTDAEYTITATNNVLKAHTRTFKIGGTKYHSYAISLLKDETPAQVLTKVKAAIDADLYSPFTATINTNVLTLVAKNNGAVGKYPISIKGNDLAGGLTFAIVNTEEGAGFPSSAPIFNETTGVVKNNRFTHTHFPIGWNIEEFSTFVNGRINTPRKVNDCVGFVAIEESYADAIDIGAEFNNAALAIFNNKSISKTGQYLGGIVCEHSDAISCVVATIAALRLTVGSSLGNFSIEEKVGGIYMAPVPIHNASLTGILPAIEFPELDFTDDEEIALNNGSISILRNNQTNTSLLMRSVVTTFKTNELGQPDDSFKFLEFYETSSLVREFFEARKTQDFAQKSLTTGDVFNEKTTTNQTAILATLDEYMYTLATDLRYLLISNNADVLARVSQEFRNSISIIFKDGIVNVDAIMPILTQLRAFNTNYYPTFEQ